MIVYLYVLVITNVNMYNFTYHNNYDAYGVWDKIYFNKITIKNHFNFLKVEKHDIKYNVRW